MKNNSIFSNPKALITFILFLLLLLGIPAGLYVALNNSENRQRAYVVPPGTALDSCKLVEINLQEDPTCPRLTVSSDGNNTCTLPDATARNNVTTYNLTINVKTHDGKSHSVHFNTFNNFCTGGYGDFKGNGTECHCNDQQQQNSGTLPVASNGVVASTKVTRSSPNGTSCGSYQFDFVIDKIDGKSCTWGSAEAHPGGVGHCETGTSCTSVPSPTPTLTPTPTPSTCGGPCTTNTDCPTDHTCSSGKCVLTACLASGATCDSNNCNQITPTPSPTVCPTPGSVNNVKIMCPNCPSQ